MSFIGRRPVITKYKQKIEPHEWYAYKTRASGALRDPQEIHQRVYLERLPAERLGLRPALARGSQPLAQNQGQLYSRAGGPQGVVPVRADAPVPYRTPPDERLFPPLP